MLKDKTTKIQSLTTLLIAAFIIIPRFIIILTNKVSCNVNAQELLKNPSIIHPSREYSLKLKTNLNSASKNVTLA